MHGAGFYAIMEKKQENADMVWRYFFGLLDALAVTEHDRSADFLRVVINSPQRQVIGFAGQ